MTETAEPDPELQAFLAKLPETYTIDPELWAAWNEADSKAVVLWPKAALVALHVAVDQLSSATVALAGATLSAAGIDREAAIKGYVDVGTAAINAQNAMRRSIAIIAATQMLEQLQAERAEGKIDG